MNKQELAEKIEQDMTKAVSELFGAANQDDHAYLIEIFKRGYTAGFKGGVTISKEVA